MNNGHSLISIIIPVYNVEKYISRCIDSVMNQTYKNIEILLIDDGSKDSSLKICNEYASRDKRIKVFHKENGGVSSARNLGLQMATGDYIGFVDGDDWIDLSMYEKMHNNLIKNNDDIEFCLLQDVHENGKILQRCETTLENMISEHNLKYFLLTGRKELENKYVTDCIIGSVCRLLIKYNLAKQIKFDINLKFSEDLVYILNLLKLTKKLGILNEYVYNYYMRSSSATNDFHVFKCQDYMNTINAITKTVNYIVDEKYIECTKFDIYRSYCIKMLKSKNKKALKELKNTEFDQSCNTRKAYKAFLQINKGFKTKLISFLVYKRFYFIGRLLYVITKKK